MHNSILDPTSLLPILCLLYYFYICTKEKLQNILDEKHSKTFWLIIRQRQVNANEYLKTMYIIVSTPSII